ncbi:lactosylceramide 4-alpha-galactosyltransferase [Diachasma alloeum]|uniref:lactosylceramide 4-alpha-galactosyltransferase n=1 Tax=Diachasma alloeum TaxID=454923 RepID=UPI00073833AC|nr:lactosylceramide 4-alpha-galactosyltransferase [Diachasma alloeum]
MGCPMKSTVTMMVRPMMRRDIALGFCLGVLLYIVYFVVNNNSTWKESLYFPEQHTSDEASHIRRNEPGFIEPLLSTDVNEAPEEGKGIFFLETSPFREEGVSLTARQACAVESAARMNPTMQVYFLLLNQSKISAKAQDFVNILLSYENIKIRQIFMKDYVKNTLLEKWWDPKILSHSGWPTHHTSDILRYLTLAKFGGIYLDLDVVVMKSLEHLTNFVGAEDWMNVASGVLGFGIDDLGRRVADACLTELKTDFRGDMWAYNGPGVITRTLKKLCDTEHIRDMSKERCHGFTVYPPSAFYPISYPDWKLYFEAKSKNSTMQTIKDSFAIHTWNKLSSAGVITVGSEVPYALVANEFCPKIYRHSGKFF